MSDHFSCHPLGLTLPWQVTHLLTWWRSKWLKALPNLVPYILWIKISAQWRQHWVSATTWSDYFRSKDDNLCSKLFSSLLMLLLLLLLLQLGLLLLLLALILDPLNFLRWFKPESVLLISKLTLIEFQSFGGKVIVQINLFVILRGIIVAMFPDVDFPEQLGQCRLK